MNSKTPHPKDYKELTYNNDPIPGVHHSINLRAGTLAFYPFQVKIKEAFILSRDQNWLWGYWGSYAHDREKLINPVLMNRELTKKQWKNLSEVLRFEILTEDGYFDYTPDHLPNTHNGRPTDY